VEEAEEENLTVADKAKKVKKAMEEYKALDHEDMVSSSPFPHELYSPIDRRHAHSIQIHPLETHCVRLNTR
jgi:hypothetical protein